MKAYGNIWRYISWAPKFLARIIITVALAVWHRLRRTPPRIPLASVTPLPMITTPQVSDDALRKLTDARLVRAWQLSYVLLEHARRAEDLLALSDLRRRYLDELERRDPAGFALWLANGPRAASNPARYLKIELPPAA